MEGGLKMKHQGKLFLFFLFSWIAMALLIGILCGGKKEKPEPLQWEIEVDTTQTEMEVKHER